jgi:hypothetical protein
MSKTFLLPRASLVVASSKNSFRHRGFIDESCDCSNNKRNSFRPLFAFSLSAEDQQKCWKLICRILCAANSTHKHLPINNKRLKSSRRCCKDSYRFSHFQKCFFSPRPRSSKAKRLWPRLSAVCVLWIEIFIASDEIRKRFALRSTPLSLARSLVWGCQEIINW